MVGARKMDVIGHPSSLEDLNERVREDLLHLCYPPANWVPKSWAPGGQPVTDIVIIGGGMCGLAAAFSLLRGGMRNLRILDRSPQGIEGPWQTYARMETLRSPKHLVGPACGLASLTFQAWYRSQFGDASWDLMERIPRPLWMDYLRWYRDILALPVENEVEVERIEPFREFLRLHLRGAATREREIFARKVILATGREGMGRPTIPEFVEQLPRSRWAHSSGSIDFEALRGKRIVVIGVGASAVDNAAEALEAGALEVRLLARRKKMPTINKMMGIGSFGFTAGYAALSDEWRWRFMQYSFEQQTPAPRGSTLRVSRNPNAYFHFDAEILRAEEKGCALTITTKRGAQIESDFIILATGFTIDPSSRAELSGWSDKILLWRDRYHPPEELENEEIGQFPYLDEGFAFQEKEPGTASWLNSIHCFNYGATISLGKVSGDIPAISDGAMWLAQHIAARVYTHDVEVHFRRMIEYSKPELRGDEWQTTPLPLQHLSGELVDV